MHKTHPLYNQLVISNTPKTVGNNLQRKPHVILSYPAYSKQDQLTALWDAVTEGKCTEVYRLLEKVPAHTVYVSKRSSESCLARAIRQGNDDIAHALISKRAECNYGIINADYVESNLSLAIKHCPKVIFCLLNF